MQSSFDTLEANLAVHYLNSQLVVNHNSALKRHEAYKEIPNITEERRNSYAWARYSARQKGRNYATFHFSFNAPTISFVCDHDALLQVNLRSASLAPEGTQFRDDIPSVLQDISIIFRITTERRSIVGNDAKLGDHESRIHLLVFDFEHANLVSMSGDGIEHSRAETIDLERHLLSYLKSLQTGGHHVLFFPPEFDEDESRSPIRFSLTSGSPKPLNDIHGFTATMINSYLALLWYTCAFIARERAEAHPAIWDATTALAECTSWTMPGYRSEWHSSIRFGTPAVTILCAREVILYFTLSEVSFFTEQEIEAEIYEKPEPDYKGWSIAMILNVHVTSTGLMVDASGARYGAQFSTFEPPPTPEHEIAWETLVDFFVEQYFKLTAKTTLQYLFHRLRDDTARITGTYQEADGSWWMLERDSRFGANALDSTIRHTRMYGFDVVIAISQTSINNQLRIRLSRMHELARWESEDFTVDVKTIAVRLLGEQNRAIVTVSISEGTLRSLLNDRLELEESEAYRFGECRVAFEVDLLQCEHSDLANPDYSPRPYEYPPPAGEEDHNLRHIYLDLAHARHSPERTYFEEAEFDDIDRRVPMTLMYFIKREYFEALIRHGLHVVASVPVFRTNGATRFYRLTSMTFRTFSVEVNQGGRADTEQPAVRPEQIMFILGMTGKSAIPSIETFRPSTRWIVHASAGFSHGTLAISRATFISRLFSLLARVNALTTLVPVSPSYDMNTDVGDIVLQWAKHPDFRDQPCEWKAVDSDEYLTADRLEWKYAREWRLQEEGTKLPVKGEYNISCTTHNELELPDITMLSTGSLDVRMSGQIRLRIASARNENTWSTESSAFWKVSIAIKTAGRGIVKVEVDGIDNVKQTPPKTTIRRGNAEVPDAYAILQRHLPQSEDFTELLQELQELEGAWKYYYPSSSAFTLCSPTFNFDGDLLFELRRSQVYQQFTVVSETTTATRTSEVRGGRSSGSGLSSRSNSPTPGVARPPMRPTSPNGRRSNGQPIRPSSPGGGRPGLVNRPSSPNGGRYGAVNRPSSPSGDGTRRPNSPGIRGGPASRPASPVRRPSNGQQGSPGGGSPTGPQARGLGGILGNPREEESPAEGPQIAAQRRGRGPRGRIGLLAMG